MGSDNANFGFAAKKTLANGADFHIKSDLTGQLELAHVSVSVFFILKTTSLLSALQLYINFRKFLLVNSMVSSALWELKSML